MMQNKTSYINVNHLLTQKSHRGENTTRSQRRTPVTQRSNLRPQSDFSLQKTHLMIKLCKRDFFFFSILFSFFVGGGHKPRGHSLQRLRFHCSEGENVTTWNTKRPSHSQSGFSRLSATSGCITWLFFHPDARKSSCVKSFYAQMLGYFFYYYYSGVCVNKSNRNSRTRQRKHSRGRRGL